MGERCTQYRYLGKPNKLRSTSRSELCDGCIQAGYTPEDAPTDKEPAVRQDQRCEVCGRPAVVGFGNWEPLFSTSDDIDPDSTEVYFCEKHWVHLNEEGAITTISPVDETPQPPEEVFGEVLKAARVLFKENVTDEELIIPTLAFANQASGLPELPTIRAKFAEIVSDHQHRERFSHNFSQRFKGLAPETLADGVLILRGHRLSPDVSWYPGTSILKEVRIDVFLRSVKPAEVESLYNQILEQAGARYDESRQALVGYRASDTYVSVVVNPDKELDTDQIARLSSRGGQLMFPHRRS